MIDLYLMTVVDRITIPKDVRTQNPRTYLSISSYNGIGELRVQREVTFPIR
jgi:hypothetical protein